MKQLLRVINRTKNRIFFHYKKDISPISKGIYKIALQALYHENKDVICDLLTEDIIIHIPDLEYHVVITKTGIIVTNHEFPSLGNVEPVVIERVFERAKSEISRIRQITKNEILNNNRDLIHEVQDKLRESSRVARVKTLALTQ